METMSLLWLFSESTASQPTAPPVFTAVPEQYITHRPGLPDAPLASQAQPSKMYERLQPPGLKGSVCLPHTMEYQREGCQTVCDKTRQGTVTMSLGQGSCNREFEFVIQAGWYQDTCSWSPCWEQNSVCIGHPRR